jgi:hypothetical protein
MFYIPNAEERGYTFKQLMMPDAEDGNALGEER